MSPFFVLSFIVGYFVLLLVVSWYTGRKADNTSFFTGNRQSPWYVVAFGMIGASLSGVTFISVPGEVGSTDGVMQFSYMQMVLGYFVGYLVIMFVLLPIYYRMKLTSIYTYLEERLGFRSYKTGAWFFIFSRVIGAAFRLYLVANVLQISVFDAWKVPFAVTVLITIVLIWLYTNKGGIKTIIWTDTLQTLMMLLAVGVSIVVIAQKMNLDFVGLVNLVQESSYAKMFFFQEYKSPNFFYKQFFAGMFFAIVMTGLDQDMMQKNLSCRNLKDAQKNMFWFSTVLIFVNLIFLGLGALLYIYADHMQIALPVRSDDVYPFLASQLFLGPLVGVFFVMGLIAAAYSSADSALTALTTSFSVDILNIDKYPKEKHTSIRRMVHVGISLVILVVILIFRALNDESVVSSLFTVAGYTYGPLLGLFSFGILTSRKVNDKAVPYIALLSPLICYLMNVNAEDWFNGYRFGFELLILNGLITFMFSLLFSTKNNKNL